MWYWNPLGAVGLLAALTAWAIAVLVYRARPDRSQNRRLALVFVAEGVILATGAGLLYLTEVPATAYGVQLIGYTMMLVTGLLYLLFLGTIESPLARPLRSPWATTALMIATVALPVVLVLDPRLLVQGVRPTFYSQWEAEAGPAFTPIALFLMLVSLYGLAVTFTAWRRAPRGSAARTRAAWYTVSFGVRDANVFVAVFVIGLADYDRLVYIIQHVTPLVAVVAHLLLAYGILRAQLFDIDLKVKWTIKRSTVAGAFVAVFLVASQLVENLSDGLGLVGGSIAAGLLLFAMAPLQRLGDRLADRALPAVQATPEYAAHRKLTVYESAFAELIVDGTVTDKERRVLAGLAGRLGIAPADAAAVERDILAAGAPVPL